MSLRVTQANGVSVYTISGSNTSRSLPDWLARKRKRSLKNDEAYQNRVELIQDFEFEEASQCIQVSEDGEYAMATGTYKPQMHIYHLPSSSLKYSRHTSALNLTFLLLSQDYSKSLHLQTDRSLEFHTPMGCHYATRIPRYGRSLAYLKPQAHAIVTAEGNEVFRLDLEAGRFLKPFELGGYEGIGGEVKSVECVGVADGSHGLLAFGTSAGTTEFWDPRSRNRVGVLAPPPNSGLVADTLGDMHTPSITATQFHRNGLTLATGNQAGIITLYDMRSPNPLLSKDQGYGFPIQTLQFLRTQTNAEEKVMSADKRIIKLWDAADGKAWTAIEPSVDLNHVTHITNSGMIMTANEGQQMHAFLIPALGPSPEWCSHLDTQIEQLADRSINDPDAYNAGEAETYDNYKFLTKAEMRSLALDTYLEAGKGANIIRPYMHGYFVSQKLYDEVRLINNPFEWEQQRQRLVSQKIEKERESRIRTSAKDKVKINKRLAERIEHLEHKLNKKSKDAEEGEEEEQEKVNVAADPRFAGLFSDQKFEVDETSREFQLLNPSTKPNVAAAAAAGERKRGKTAVELEAESDSEKSGSDSEESSEEEDNQEQYKPAQKKKEPEMRISSSTYRKSGHDTRGFAAVSKNQKIAAKKERTFGSRAAGIKDLPPPRAARGATSLGDKEVTFVPTRKPRPERKPRGGDDDEDRPSKPDNGSRGRNFKDRRSASGNAFRNMGISSK
ncbi:Similar to Ribosome biogenesis protein enp2 homolog; acc. no. O74879 [Pyronema omphalodes CBS 100304]|uniref:Similar to Ribosome biogenesis protein enp2 homolog acc. no. O74879 n=1 Tax=Pyronema omphalodes (strain CBS 100304) TaxID=1076935 RepID=U4LI77_PYROM|nr:Similar to Ribosome biogenesis protein enp2 homolog; acc. no. O74879 [Pyronema omphalodes CBS 100304]